MPKQNRYSIKQKLDTVMKELDRAQTKLIEVAQPFKTVHVTYYNRFSEIVTGVEALKKVVEILSDSI